jgi:hypothetical protein
MGEKQNAFGVLAWKQKEKGQIEWCGMDWIDLAQDRDCEQSNELLGPTHCWESHE